MPLPHWELIGQCNVVAQSLPIETWDMISRRQQWAAGLVSKWAIQKSFEAFFLFRGEAAPSGLTLLELHRASGVSLSEDQANYLEIVDEQISAQEPDSDSNMERYFRCCWLARGVAQSVQQLMGLIDISKRNKTQQT